MITGIAPTPVCSWIRRSISQPSTWGIITSSRIRSGDSLAERREPLLGARRLAHLVALGLEIDADVLAQPRVVVDDQDERSADVAGAGAPPRPGAVEELVEVGAAVATVAAGRVEGRDAAEVGPLAHRALRDAEVLRGLAECQPLGLRRAGALLALKRHRTETTQTCSYLKPRPGTCQPVVTVTVTVRAAGGSGCGCSVRTFVCVPPGSGPSSSARPSEMPTRSSASSAERGQRRPHEPVPPRRQPGGAGAAVAHGS